MSLDSYASRARLDSRETLPHGGFRINVRKRFGGVSHCGATLCQTLRVHHTMVTQAIDVAILTNNLHHASLDMDL